MKEAILALAKAAIFTAVGHPTDLNLTQLLTDYPKLQERGATFVTITQGTQHHLRGCIGSLQAYRPLYQDILHNAKAAALKDPRFSPLRPDELREIAIEVSLLTSPQPLSYTSIDDLKQKLHPKVDGVILKHHHHRATYLPQVWEQLPHFEEFFHSLCRKAGLASDCLKYHPHIETYQVVKYGN